MGDAFCANVIGENRRSRQQCLHVGIFAVENPKRIAIEAITRIVVEALAMAL